MATPTLGAAFARAVFKGRHLGPNGEALTIERITRVLAGGLLEVRGVVIPVSGMGMNALRAGSKVAVAWDKGRPLVAIAHSARRSGAPVPLPTGGGGIVEELFIAGAAGARDVYFRNDQQVTALELRAKLPGDPVDVRWGADTRSFVVRVGGPLTAIDFTGAVENAPQDQTYHVFAFVDAEEGTVFGADEPRVTRLASYAPADSSLEVLAYTAEWGAASFERYLRLVSQLTEDGLLCKFNVFEVTEVADTARRETGTHARVSVTLGEILRQQAFPEAPGETVAWGPSEITDFALDRARHLLLAVRGKTQVEARVVITPEGQINTRNLGACGWDETAVPAGDPQAVASHPGEAHAWVVDCTAGTVLFRTTEAEAALADVAMGPVDLVASEMIYQQLAAIGACAGDTCTAPPSTLEPASASPYPGGGFFPFGPPVEYGLLPALTVTPKAWRDLWDETRFGFIPAGGLKQTGTLVTQDRERGIFLAEGEYLGDVASIPLHYTITAPSLPPPAPLYHVRDVRLLRGPQTAAHPLLLFVVVYRETPLDQAMHWSAYVLRLDGTIVRVLKDWTAMQEVPIPAPFPSEPSELEGGLAHDGARAALIGGNAFHVLWEYSTKAERDAGQRNIRLTQLATGLEIAVGTAWPEFQQHDFRLLNLDVLYAAKDDDDHKLFVEAWDEKSGAPTLSQAAEGYPIEDTELEPVKVLADLEAETPPAIVRVLQAVNDEAALAQTGRTLQPETP